MRCEKRSDNTSGACEALPLSRLEPNMQGCKAVIVRHGVQIVVPRGRSFPLRRLARTKRSAGRPLFPSNVLAAALPEMDACRASADIGRVGPLTLVARFAFAVAQRAV